MVSEVDRFVTGSKEPEKTREVLNDVNYSVFEGTLRDSDGNKKKVTDWTGTRFIATTKDGHDIWLTLSSIDITDADELNRAILVARKLVSDVTLKDAKRLVLGKRFAVSDSLVGGASHWFLMIERKGALHAVRTPSRMHTHTPRFTAPADAPKRMGFYGLSPAEPLHGKNSRFRMAIFHFLNGNLQGALAQYLPMVNNYIKLVETATSRLEDMNQVAGEVKKYGEKGALRRNLTAQHEGNHRAANHASTRLDRSWITEETLLERDRLLEQKRNRLLRLESLETGGESTTLRKAKPEDRTFALTTAKEGVQLWAKSVRVRVGSSFRDPELPEIAALREEIVLLQKERDYAQQVLTFLKWDSDPTPEMIQLSTDLPGDVVAEQGQALDLLDDLLSAREDIEREIGRQEQLLPFQQDLYQVRLQKERLDKAIGLIERVIDHRTEVIKHPESKGYLPTILQVQTAVNGVRDDLCAGRNWAVVDGALARAAKLEPRYRFHVLKHMRASRWVDAQKERWANVTGNDADSATNRALMTPLRAAGNLIATPLSLPWDMGLVDMATDQYDRFMSQKSPLEPISEKLGTSPAKLRQSNN